MASGCRPRDARTGRTRSTAGVDPAPGSGTRAADRDGPHREGRLGLDGLLHLALVGDPDERVVVLLRKRGRHLDVDLDARERPRRGIDVVALHEPDPLRREAALLAKARDVDAGAGADRREEEVERGGRRVLTAARHGLVRPDDVVPDPRVHLLAARQRDDHLGRHARLLLRGVRAGAPARDSGSRGHMLASRLRMRAKEKAKPVSRAALAGEADPRLVAMSVSIQDDVALYAEDIRGRS